MKLNKKKIKKIESNFIDFVKEERAEFKELAAGKENFGRFCRDAGSIFKDYFVPHEGNGHKPKILRTKSLLFIILTTLLVKAAVTGYLFLIYPNQAKMSEEITVRLLDLINLDRKNNNLYNLKADSVLTKAALAKAQDMLANNYFSHYGPQGKKPWDWIDRSAYPYLYAGENLAMNFSSAGNVHAALMQSSLHRKNILNGKYKDIGLAVLNGRLNSEKTNVLVELFASKQTASAKIERIEIQPTAEAIKATSAPIVASAEIQPTVPTAIITPLKDSKINLAQKLVVYSGYFYIILLAFMTVSLLINILVKANVQYKPMIVQALLVILFITSMIYIRFHVLENIFDSGYLIKII